MKSSWNPSEAAKCGNDPLKLRVYTSRLLGQESDLVLQGGGNTSVKTSVKNVFGETEEVLYVKGSGWDLATIEAAGFAPVKMDALLKMARLSKMTDAEMVRAQRAAMTDPNAPNPSVEAILHAIIPFKFVDHTHADAVVTITNTPDGEKRIKDLYGKRVLYVPYVMPGFILARKVFEMTQDLDWKTIEGIVLLNHGIFTFHDDAKKSYEKMIALVTEAEEYLVKQKAVIPPARRVAGVDLKAIAVIRREVSRLRGAPMLAKILNGVPHFQFANLEDVSQIAARGTLTPDHIIRTKRTAAILGKEPSEGIKKFADDYDKYFKKHTEGKLTRLDAAPRWAVWPDHGLVAFGDHINDVSVVADIVEHTILAIQKAERLGGWRALPEKDLFDVEYWELEQAKLKKAGKPPAFQGKIALVTGAASGIGAACVEALHAQGAAVVAVDINPEVQKRFTKKGILARVADLTDPKAIADCVGQTVANFGGLDILVSNAGIFPPSETIEAMRPETWEKSMAINLTGHQRLLTACVPFLKEGIDPAVVMIASKNVPAPGPGASAYSVAKAGLTQLARVAALELGAWGIRVNVIHPNQVFDTAIWTKEVLEKRAKMYGVSVEDYKTSNILKVEIKSSDVAALVCAMAGPVFSKTTGCQVTIDGGNDRVI
jgi:rhamnose utilization protein RhaD (predicted bifunctional aldolase and dehydrogenase)/NAD(P)-dependent dehydrogenase (short-subunit alcohol dehydrogenase family)